MAAPVRLVSFHQMPVSSLDLKSSDPDSPPLATPLPSAPCLGQDSLGNTSAPPAHARSRPENHSLQSPPPRPYIQLQLRQELHDLINQSPNRRLSDAIGVARYIVEFKCLSGPLISSHFMTMAECDELFEQGFHPDDFAILRHYLDGISPPSDLSSVSSPSPPPVQSRSSSVPSSPPPSLPLSSPPSSPPPQVYAEPPLPAQKQPSQVPPPPAPRVHKVSPPPVQNKVPPPPLLPPSAPCMPAAKRSPLSMRLESLFSTASPPPSPKPPLPTPSSKSPMPPSPPSLPRTPPPSPYELTPPPPSSIATASPKSSEATKETPISNTRRAKEQAEISSTGNGDANPIAKSEPAEVLFIDHNNPDNSSESKTARNNNDNSTNTGNSSSKPSDADNTDHKSGHKHNHTFDPRGVDIRKSNFAYDPGGNIFNKDCSTRDNDDDTSNHSNSSIVSRAVNTHPSFDHDRDKTASTVPDVKSVHADHHVSDTTPSRSTDNVPPILLANPNCTDEAKCPPLQPPRHNTTNSSDSSSIANAITARTLSTSILDFDTATNNSTGNSHNNASDADADTLDDNSGTDIIPPIHISASTTAPDNEPERKYERARLPPFDVSCDVPPSTAPHPDIPEEPPPHWTRADAVDNSSVSDFVHSNEPEHECAHINSKSRSNRTINADTDANSSITSNARTSDADTTDSNSTSIHYITSESDITRTLQHQHFDDVTDINTADTNSSSNNNRDGATSVVSTARSLDINADVLANNSNNNNSSNINAASSVKAQSINIYIPSPTSVSTAARDNEPEFKVEDERARTPPLEVRTQIHPIVAPPPDKPEEPPPHWTHADAVDNSIVSDIAHSNEPEHECARNSPLDSCRHACPNLSDNTLTRLISKPSYFFSLDDFDDDREQP